jgi:two-component system sensor histidine kinase TctE
LIDDLLAGESAAPFEGSADLGRLAEQAAADLRATTGRDVIVRADVDRAVHGDEIALARVLENLLSNAAKYAPEGSIELNVATADVGSIIEVADRGPGIPPADRKRVMQPFARLERDEARLPGTGLGLTVVRSIADALGGHVEILENPGGGTIARVVLPDSGQS